MTYLLATTYTEPNFNLYLKISCLVLPHQSNLSSDLKFLDSDNCLKVVKLVFVCKNHKFHFSESPNPSPYPLPLAYKSTHFSFIFFDEILRGKG